MDNVLPTESAGWRSGGTQIVPLDRRLYKNDVRSGKSRRLKLGCNQLISIFACPGFEWSNWDFAAVERLSQIVVSYVGLITVTFAPQRFVIEENSGDRI
jgi:hypothetical protein